MGLLDAIKLCDELKQMEDDLRPALVAYKDRAYHLYIKHLSATGPTAGLSSEAGRRVETVDDLLRLIEKPCAPGPE